ncbi:MAG TPA: hypothetical protein VHF27_07925 [Acidimicrobiales bacterium]|nr:hypothetical protein [Acidimicrobiales bacterium]
MTVGMLLNASTQLLCPHGGTVTVVTTNTRAKAAGAFILRSSDTFVVAGCPFTVGPVAHPCVSVKWVQPTLQSKEEGVATLSADSVGVCHAADQAVQGTVTVASTQSQVGGR